MSYEGDSSGFFFHLMRFLLCILIASSFLIPLKYCFLNFFHLCMFDGFLFQYSYVFLSFLFSERSDFLLIWYFYSSVNCRFLFFLIRIAHFSMPNSIPLSSLYILTACIRVSNSFSFLTNSFMSSMYIRRLIFFCDLLSLYQPVHFMRMSLNDVIAILNSNGNSASLWNITLRIFTSSKPFPPIVSSTVQFCVVLSINFITLSDILYLFMTVYYPTLQDHVICFCVVGFFHPGLLSLRMC